MAKTPEQMISMFAQHAERSRRGLEAARVSGNGELAAFNIQQCFKALLMQGLIGWRTGVIVPVDSMRIAVSELSEGIELLWRQGFERHIEKIPVERAAIISHLIEQPRPASQQDNLVAASRLDAVIADGLEGDWNESAWDHGMDELEKLEGSALAIETYVTYRQLLLDTQDKDTLAEHAAALFEKRKRDPYYDAQEMSEGGGLSNTITVDYRLGALMRKAGVRHKSIHSWNWI